MTEYEGKIIEGRLYTLLIAESIDKFEFSRRPTPSVTFQALQERPNNAGKAQ